MFLLIFDIYPALSLLKTSKIEIGNYIQNFIEQFPEINFSIFQLIPPIMEQEGELVILDYGIPITKAMQVKGRKQAFTADQLFKNIENEIEAKKDMKQMQNQNALHEKFRKALEKKLGSPKLMRCMSAKEQKRMKELVQTCKQRKHTRQKTRFDRPQTARPRVSSAKPRNFSYNANDRNKFLQNQRPKTANPSRAISIQLQKSTHIDQILVSPINLIGKQRKKIENSKLKKQNHKRIHSKLPQPEKLSNFYQTNTSRQIQKQNHFSQQTKQDNKYSTLCTTPELINPLHSGYGRKMKNKNMVKIKNKFYSILENCDNVRQDIVCLGKKIGHFQYFCQKINSKKSNIQRYCRKAEQLQKDMDESF